MALYRLEVSAFAYEKCKLKRLTSGKPQYGANERSVERESVSQPRYVRITDINEYGRLKPGLGVAAEQTEEKYLLCNGDLLFARSGNTVGKAYLHNASGKEKHIFAGYMIRFRTDVKKVLPEYVFLCTQLRFYQHWVTATQRATGQPNINAEEYRNLEIPVPGIDVQRLIAAQYQDAIERFEASMQSAHLLLNGIDPYLLCELGITLPPEPENTITNRIFTAQRKELAGWRFDARVHQYDFNLHSARHPNLPLKQLAHINPRTVFFGIKDETSLTFVPMESISDEDGTIAAPQQRNYSENVGYTSFQEGDLLWAKITPCMENGKSAVALNLLNGFGFGSTEYHVLRPKSGDLSVHYLHAILRMKRLRKAAENYFGGSSGHQRVDEAFFYRLSIPVPSPEIQVQLAKRIESMRQEAQQLRSNALAELNAAKSRIEAMLLGEVTI